MGEIDELVEEARAAVRAVLESASDRLDAGADLSATHAVIKRAVSYLEDIEAYALLAGAPDRVAEAAISRLMARLKELSDDLSDQED